MTQPARIQRQRTKGWRMPENTVYVGRPSLWGNPWALDDRELVERPRPDGTPWDASDLVRWFRDYVRAISAHHPDFFAPLRGKNLACWCELCDEHKDGLPLGVGCQNCAPCHSMVLLELANPA